MRLLSTLNGFAASMMIARQYSHLLVLSDQELAARGLTRDALKEDYLAALDRAHDRRKSTSDLPSLGGFAQST